MRFNKYSGETPFVYEKGLGSVFKSVTDVVTGGILGGLGGQLMGGPVGSILGSVIGAAQASPEAPEAPTAPGMSDTITAEMGAVGEGAGKTFSEEEESKRRKAIKKRKLGTTQLRIPLEQQTSAKAAGLATSGDIGLSI